MESIKRGKEVWMRKGDEGGKRRKASRRGREPHVLR